MGTLINTNTMKPLTKEQLRDNAAAMLAFADGKPIQFNPSANNDPDAKWLDTIDLTEIETVWHRPKPQPVSRPWSKPEDVPGPVCWIRQIDERNNERMIVHVDGSGIFSGSQIRCVMFGNEFLKWEYSTDRKTWKPCTVEEQP